MARRRFRLLLCVVDICFLCAAASVVVVAVHDAETYNNITHSFSLLSTGYVKEHGKSNMLLAGLLAFHRTLTMTVYQPRRQ